MATPPDEPEVPRAFLRGKRKLVSQDQAALAPVGIFDGLGAEGPEEDVGHELRGREWLLRRAMNCLETCLLKKKSVEMSVCSTGYIKNVYKADIVKLLGRPD